MGKRMMVAAAAAALLLPGAALAATRSFDVEQATRAYLDLLQGPARARSDAYFEGGYWLILWNALVAVALYGLLLVTGWSARLRAMAERVTSRRWLVPAIYGLLFTLVTFALFLPWSIYTGFVREAQYGLINQSFGAWMGDQAKALGLSLVINPLAFMAIYAVIRRVRAWWAVASAITVAFIALGVLIAPVFIAPLFNSYTEMPAGPLRDRIVAVARANDISAQHIYVSDASRQTKRISANVSGLGPTIRITLNDNLLERTTPDEVVAVMGHEMGHYVLHHVWWLLLGFSLAALATFVALWWLAPRIIARRPGWGVRGVGDPASAPLLLALVAVSGLILTPYVSTLSREVENQADAFGLDAVRQPDAFARVAVRLAEYRKLEPSRVEELVFFDHPSGETRIRRAMQWKRDHVPDPVMVKPTL